MKIIGCVCIFILLSINTVLYAGETIKIYAPPSIWAQINREKLSGPVIDLVEEIFSEFNIRVSTKLLPWARAIEQMKTGELDMIPVIFHTQERARFMEFTIPYVQVPTAVFVPKGKSFPFSKLDNLKNRQGLMMREDSISTEFESFESNLNITRVTDYEQIFNMLTNNRADYAVAAQYGFLIHAKQLGYENKIELLPHPITTRNLYCGFSKNSRFIKYLPIVDKKLKKFQEEGRIEKMVETAIHLASEK